jgi:hypothetical protein
VSPNVWHNPTGVFAMPFALLLFVVGWRALEAPGTATLALTGAATVLSLLAKPNYVLAFAPCFGVAAAVALYRAVRARRLTVPGATVAVLAALGPPLAVLVFQYRSAFGADAGEPGGVIFAPWAAWRQLTDNIPASLLLGIAFPVAVLGLYLRQVAGDKRLVLAWAVMAVAVGEYALLAESGSRFQFNNFGWGPMLADQVLFVASCGFLLRQPASRRRQIAFAVLGLHVASGLLCLARCLMVPSLAGLF